MNTTNIKQTRAKQTRTEFESGLLKTKLKTKLKILYDDLKRNKLIYLMLIPALVYIIVFRYVPMYGVQIAFKDYSFSRGIWGSEWIGLRNFRDFFTSIYCWRVIRNTILINLISLFFAFPIPIILALLLNEVKCMAFKRTVQTITYMPYFVSLVVTVGIIYDFFSNNGIVNSMLSYLGIEPIQFLQKPQWFRPLYIGSGIWQEAGWNSILYLAALTNIDPTLYEASDLDGANRWKQTLHVTLPGIMPVIVIMLILRMGNMMNVGIEKIILMYNPLTLETGEVISTYVYKRGIQEMSYGFSAAVGLINSTINLILLTASNWMSSKLSENKLW
ncbi:MAG TPA: ABC transporter permease subunit [Clostridiales bacterium]|nr:ABC transporter permease subunit [Clostridiales bacterium]